MAKNIATTKHIPCRRHIKFNNYYSLKTLHNVVQNLTSLPLVKVSLTVNPVVAKILTTCERLWAEGCFGVHITHVTPYFCIPVFVNNDRPWLRQQSWQYLCSKNSGVRTQQHCASRSLFSLRCQHQQRGQRRMKTSHKCSRFQCVNFGPDRAEYQFSLQWTNKQCQDLMKSSTVCPQSSMNQMYRRSSGQTGKGYSFHSA